MATDKRYLSIEDPCATGTLDFLSHRVTVEVTIVDGDICVTTKASHGEGSSSWDQHNEVYALPEREDEPVCAEARVDSRGTVPQEWLK